MPSSRREIRCQVSKSLWEGIHSEMQRTGQSLSHLVERALATELDIAHHSLFQVSTSRALVEGVFGGCLRVADLKEHGDFGLGTFEQLDGEMMMLDGRCHQVLGCGAATEVTDEALIPFAMITRFVADQTIMLKQIRSFATLEKLLDRLRPTDNLFLAFRIKAEFKKLSLRAACKAQPGEKLVTAVQHQSEFEFQNCSGTLIGFWSPPYSGSISVPGYHFHFIDDSHLRGGHVLDFEADQLDVEMHVHSDIHLALPETTEFLKADLTQDGTKALQSVETRHQK